MENIHVIFSDWNFKQVKILSQFNIQVKVGYDNFQIEEGDAYNKIKGYLNDWGVSDSVVSKFSEDDLSKVNLLVFNGVWANGYPMPDDDDGYKNITYNSNSYCQKCGGGLVQMQPFRLKKAPAWGDRELFSLNWIFDEIFVRKDFYENVLKSYDIEARPVFLYKKEVTVEDTVQINIPITEDRLRLDSYSYIICDNCSRKRYDLISHGFFPPFIKRTNKLHLFKSFEDFGTGGNTRKYIFISQDLRQIFLKHKIKIKYIPCQLS